MPLDNLTGHTHFGLSVVVLGNDALIEALPARPIQFAHACRAAGFDLALPASWGDELVAEATLRALETTNGRPAVFCACPLVRRRLLAGGPELEYFLLPSVAPPVAAGRYVRALLGARLAFLAYVGGCPSGSDKVFDAHYSPRDFLGKLREQRIDLLQQPEVFDAVLPPDRRRHVSLPGGCPTPEALALRSHERSLVSVEGNDVTLELAQYLLTRQPVLIDASPALGCACSGVTERTSGASARVAVMSLEPPRATASVIDTSLLPALEVSITVPKENPGPDSDPEDPAGEANLRQVPAPEPTNHDDSAPSSVEAMPPGRPRFAVTPPAALPATESRRPTRAAPQLPDDPVRHGAAPKAVIHTSIGSDEGSTPRARKRAPVSSVTYVSRALSHRVPKIAVEERPAEHLPRAYMPKRPAYRRGVEEDVAANAASPAVDREVALPVEVEETPASGSAMREPSPAPSGAEAVQSHTALPGERQPAARMPAPPRDRWSRDAAAPTRGGWPRARRFLVVALLIALLLVALQLLAR